MEVTAFCTATWQITPSAMAGKPQTSRQSRPNFGPGWSANKRDPNKLGTHNTYIGLSTKELDTIPVDIALDMGLWMFRLG